MKVALVYDKNFGGAYRRIVEIQKRSKHDVSIVNESEDLNQFDLVHSYEEHYVGDIHTVATYMRQAQDYFKVKSKYTLKYFLKGIKELSNLHKFKIIISRSESEQNWLKKHGITSILIHAGVDCELFKPMEKEPRKEKVVLFLGRRDKAKGIHLLEKAMNYLPKYYHLNIVSDQPYELMPQIIPQADVLCLPSYTECFPLVILEALACNVPVVATDVGDIKNMIKPPQGGLLCSLDTVDISQKIRMVTNRNDFNCRNLVLKYSWDDTVSNIEKIWEGLYE